MNIDTVTIRYFVKFRAGTPNEYTEEFSTMKQAIEQAMANPHLKTEVIRAEWTTIWYSSDN